MTTTLVELCAGTASVSLWALGRVGPLTGFMGSKRRWAATLVDVLGADRPDRVVLVDAGPWGDVWSVLREERGRSAVWAIFEQWAREGVHPNALWKRLVSEPPPALPPRRVAQYLWLQARSAGTIPMWWSPERGRWESPSGSRTEIAHHRGGIAAGERGVRDRRRRTADVGPACVQGNEREPGPAYPARSDEDGGRSLGPAHDRGAHIGPRGLRSGVAVGKPDHPAARGIQHPGTIAARIRALDAIPWDRVDVVHGDVRSVSPIPGAAVLFDPPYRGAPRYAELLPRADVLDLAARWAVGGGRIVVCEAEPLDLEGWTARRLPSVRRGQASREWITCSGPVGLAEQLGLPGVAA